MCTPNLLGGGLSAPAAPPPPEPKQTAPALADDTKRRSLRISRKPATTEPKQSSFGLPTLGV